MVKTRVAVLGGGAAGYFSAITCAELNPDFSVVILEGAQRSLAKVRISGGGRCNVTHFCFDPIELVKSYPRGHKELRGPFCRFQPRDTIEWFGERGVELKAEKDGRMFPVTNDSKTITDCLEKAARDAGVDVRLGAMVKGIRKNEDTNTFVLSLRGGNEEIFDRVLLATGGTPAGHAFAQSLGHTLSSPVPSLFTFNIQDPRIAGLSGISFPEVSLVLKPLDNPLNFTQEGPLLITHWGLSGPAVLKLSAWAARELFNSHYKASLKINFFLHETKETLLAKLNSFKMQNPKKSLGSGPPVMLPKRFWSQLIHFLNLEEGLTWAQVNKEWLLQLSTELTEASFVVNGKGVFKEEFVTCGGVNLKEVNFQTMESRCCPGLYFAGEILDIDGITGGFNFQNAWTTGWIAGKNLLR